MNGNRGAIDMGDEIARQRAIGEESGGSSTRRMSMVLDGGDTPAVNGGEQPTAPRDLPPEKSFSISADSYGADCAVRLSTLVEQCRQEIQAYRRGGPSNEAHGLELLHRTIVQGDQAAGAGIQQCLSEIVLGWLRGHPSREVAYRLLSEEDYVALAFERFWQATIQQQVIFRTLAGALVYLRASLHGAILDTLRDSLRPREVSMPLAQEPVVEDQTARLAVWEILQTMLPSEREQRLAYLLYHCKLGPREMVRFCPQEWNDIQEIYRLRRDILQRLLRNAN